MGGGEDYEVELVGVFVEVMVGGEEDGDEEGGGVDC